MKKTTLTLLIALGANDAWAMLPHNRTEQNLAGPHETLSHLTHTPSQGARIYSKGGIQSLVDWLLDYPSPQEEPSVTFEDFLRIKALNPYVKHWPRMHLKPKETSRTGNNKNASHNPSSKPFLIEKRGYITAAVNFLERALDLPTDEPMDPVRAARAMAINPHHIRSNTIDLANFVKLITTLRDCFDAAGKLLLTWLATASSRRRTTQAY